MILKKIAKNQKGFSLAELLVVFMIITGSLVGIFSLVIQNIQVQKVNKEYLVASQLAQEGIELVRNIRDENWLVDDETVYDDTWNNIVNFNDDDFVIDYDNNIPADFDGINNARLYKNSDGFYSHDASGTSTPFFRIIKIVDNTSSDYIEVVSHVEWEIRGKTHKYIADTLLYDWR